MIVSLLKMRTPIFAIRVANIGVFLTFITYSHSMAVFRLCRYVVVAIKQPSRYSAIIPVIFFYQSFVGQKLVTVLRSII